MPKKRPIDVRIGEHEDKLDRLKLEKNIQDLRNRVATSRARRRTRR
jgi:hypothetical protein